MIFIFLTSGLFLGWSLGANDAANVFGTAVGTRMIRFKTAAIIASIFVVIGAVIGGAGATHTLGKLGAVNAIAGSFIVAFGAAFTVAWMTKLRLPVSTSQAIVGAIIGWNMFSGSITDTDSLTKIVSTWVLCPVLSAAFAMLLFFAFRSALDKINVHLLKMDFYTRIGLVLVGAFGAYSLGANNIANVMGVFVPVVPFEPISVYGLFTLNSAQILFFIGSLAIGLGIFTYSYKVMDTVGGGLLKLSPVAALIVVLSESLVLFLFSSEGLEAWLIGHGLPSIPLVPVSSSQAVVGAIIGIGIAKGGRGIRFSVLGEIAVGWVSTPLAAGILTFISLFIFQNVFNQQVSKKVEYCISEPVLQYLQEEQLPVENLKQFEDVVYTNSIHFNSIIEKDAQLNTRQAYRVIEASRVTPMFIDEGLISTEVDTHWFSPGQVQALRQLAGKEFKYHWQLERALQKLTDEWKLKPEAKENKLFNKNIKKKLNQLYRIFTIRTQEEQ